MANKSKTPKVSVLMPVYNGEKYLSEAIVSIIEQSFTDFELIIVDDESKDTTPDILRSFNDPRIFVVRVPHGGLVNALNSGIAHARGEYIARMDADDRAMANRFQLQVAYLDAHPDTDITCTDIYTIDETGTRRSSQVQRNVDNALLRDGLLSRRPMKPIIHPSIMMRRRVLDIVGGYRHFECAEDQDLWLRTVDRFKFARINQPLLEYRIYGDGISRTKGQIQALASAMSGVCYLIKRQAGIDIFEEAPVDFERLKGEMRERLEKKVLIPKQEFRNARLEMLNGSKLKGWLLLALTFLKYGFNALPAVNYRLEAAQITEIAENYCTNNDSPLTCSPNCPRL